MVHGIRGEVKVRLVFGASEKDWKLRQFGF